MLKITYLEDQIYLEYLKESVETWKASRILVSLYAGLSISAKPSTACLVVPMDTPYLAMLARLEAKEIIEIIPCDEEYLEITLSGTWVTSNEKSEEGIFICELSYSVEHSIYQMWQQSQLGSSLISE